MNDSNGRKKTKMRMTLIQIMILAEISGSLVYQVLQKLNMRRLVKMKDEDEVLLSIPGTPDLTW